MVKEKGVNKGNPSTQSQTANNNNNNGNQNSGSPADNNSPKKHKLSGHTPPGNQLVYTVIGDGGVDGVNIVTTPTCRSTSRQDLNVTQTNTEAISDTISSASKALSVATSDIISSASHVLLDTQPQHSSLPQYTQDLPRDTSSPPINSVLPPDNSEPPWVTRLISSIDAINTSLQSIDRRVGWLEKEVGALCSLNEKVDTLQTDVISITAKYEATRAELEQSHRDTTALAETVRINSRSVHHLTERIIDLENRSMRDNLLITGIPENHQENTESVLRDIIKNKMNITAPIDFERVHRTGGGRRRNDGTYTPRTIVAKFSRHKDRELVRTNTRRLKGTSISVN